MKREDFAKHVATSIEDVIRFAEEKTGKRLPRRYVFKRLSKLQIDEPPIPQDGVVDYLVDQLWLSENEIYPCYDIGVAGLADEDTVLLSGNRAGYAPTKFQKNWTGREGPFVLALIGDWWQESD